MNIGGGGSTLQLNSRSSTREECFESVAGDNYAALKYIAVPADDGTAIFIEVGWTKRAEAEAAHESEAKMDRLEGRVR